MRVRRQISANARRKHLKVQHHKVNSRRQFYFNQNIVLASDIQSSENQVSANITDS